MSTIVSPTTRPRLTRGERDLLARVSRYCRQAGWRYGLTSRFTAPDRSLDADWWSYHRADSTLLQISTLSRVGTPTGSVCSAEVSSVREAVDIACAYGLLPLDFSSAYRAALADAERMPRYSAQLAMRADQIEATYTDQPAPGWQILDARDETTWHPIAGVADCEDVECSINDIPGIYCVVVLSTAWAAGSAHLESDEQLQVRIPMGDPGTVPAPLAEVAARVDWCEVHQAPLDTCHKPNGIPCAPRFFSPQIGERPGYVAGQCGHATALSEWRAGFRVCERCIPDGVL